MIVASFYAPRPEIESKLWGCDYDELLMLVEASCRRFGLKHIVISDEPRPAPLYTHLCGLPQNLMQAFLIGQRSVLQEYGNDQVLFIGADCVLTADPRTLTNYYDIAITLGPFSDCEMNCGAIWCYQPRKLVPVWSNALRLNPKEWGEDQTSIYSAIIQAEVDEKIWVNRLRCEVHNWAPDGVDDKVLPTVAHFRGKRKNFMLPWAKKHLNLDPVTSNSLEQ